MDADERWIEDRLSSPTGSAADMRAAIARGYERGIAEGAADRDRLAKRYADLESRLSVANKAEAHARAQVDAYHDIGATDRLAALEQRVGALVEALSACFGGGGLGSYTALADRLAALRSLGVAKPDLDARDLRNLRDSYKGIAQALADAEIEPGHSQPDSVRLLVAALATARRERDEAIETCRETISRQREMIAARDAELARLREERDALMAWRCDVTVALGQPQGTFYADVPKLIRDALARIAELEARDREARELLMPMRERFVNGEWTKRLDDYLAATRNDRAARVASALGLALAELEAHHCHLHDCGNTCGCSVNEARVLIRGILKEAP